MSDDDFFRAALRGNVAVLQAMANLHPRLLSAWSSGSAGRHTALSLAAAAAQADAVATIISLGAELNAPDDDGTTPLMHAAMHGHARVLQILLDAGAGATLVRSDDGMNAVCLAAAYGRPNSLGVFFRADPSLVGARAANGRTPLHCAVAARQAPTAKYLLGRWRAAPDATDAHGDTPLHLVEDKPSLLLLLYAHPHPPSLERTNAAGQTAAEALAARGLNSLADALAAMPSRSWPADASMLERMESGDAGTHDHDHDEDDDERHKGHDHDHDSSGRCGEKVEQLLADAAKQTQLFSFIAASPMRARPSRVRTAWPRRLTLLNVVHVLGTAAALTHVVAVPSAFLWWSFAALAESFVEYAWASSRRRPRRRSDDDGVRAFATFAALALVTSIGFVIAINHSLIIGAAAAQAPALVVFACLCELGVFLSYGVLLAVDAGELPDDVQSADYSLAYWKALENCEDGFPSATFCDRSETPRPPRSKYSPMAGAVVRVFDHDCPWIGGPVGAGNHRAFMSLLLCGVAALLLHVAELHVVEPDGLPLHWAPLAFSLAETAEATSARLLIASALVAVALSVAISFLLYTQLTAVVDGVTTAEVMRWQRANMSALSGTRRFPSRADPSWDDYSPHDRGRWRNVVAFVRAERGVSEMELS